MVGRRAGAVSAVNAVSVFKIEDPGLVFGLGSEV